MTNNTSYVVIDSSRTNDFDNFTERAITSSSSDSQTSSIEKFNVTSTMADGTIITTTYVPENSFPTSQSNKRVIPTSKSNVSFQKVNYVDRCFEKICTDMPLSDMSPKNIGKTVFIKSIYFIVLQFLAVDKFIYVFRYVFEKTESKGSQEAASIMLGNYVRARTCQTHCYGFGKIQDDKSRQEMLNIYLN